MKNHHLTNISPPSSPGEIPRSFLRIRTEVRASCLGAHSVPVGVLGVPGRRCGSRGWWGWFHPRCCSTLQIPKKIVKVLNIWGKPAFFFWKQRCERPRFGQSPFATFLHESTHPEKKYGCTCHFNIASPTGKPQEQISLHIKLHNWKPKKPKQTKKTNKPKIPEKGWGAHSCWIFVFFVFFGFCVFFGGFAYCTACL